MAKDYRSVPHWWGKLFITYHPVTNSVSPNASSIHSLLFLEKLCNVAVTLHTTIQSTISCLMNTVLYTITFPRELGTFVYDMSGTRYHLKNHELFTLIFHFLFINCVTIHLLVHIIKCISYF